MQRLTPLLEAEADQRERRKLVPRDRDCAQKWEVPITVSPYDIIK